MREREREKDDHDGSKLVIMTLELTDIMPKTLVTMINTCCSCVFSWVFPHAQIRNIYKTFLVQDVGCFNLLEGVVVCQCITHKVHDYNRVILDTLCQSLCMCYWHGCVENLDCSPMFTFNSLGKNDELSTYNIN